MAIDRPTPMTFLIAAKYGSWHRPNWRIYRSPSQFRASCNCIYKYL